MLDEISTCLIALYLRGLPRPSNPPKRRWVKIVGLLRTFEADRSDAAGLLRSNGFWEEAVVLESDSVISQASDLLASNRVLAAIDELYPARWLERLGDGAPPALWISGAIPKSPYLGIVGSRTISEDTRTYAQEVGKEAVRLGYSIVSGGAVGCDRAGAEGAISEGGSVLEILPNGIAFYDQRDRCGLTVCAPNETFSTASAMERNGLIYSASDSTVIVHSRFKEGGTWNGAVDAVRRKLCPLIVRVDGSLASKSLINLGGAGLERTSDLTQAIAATPLQRGLFGIG